MVEAEEMGSRRNRHRKPGKALLIAGVFSL
jgi:hypothetical protein